VHRPATLDCTSSRSLAQPQAASLGRALAGSVLKLDDQELVGQLGARHADPLWAIAWKFPPMETTTRVVDVSLTIGKQGKVVGGLLPPWARLYGDSQPGMHVCIAG